MDDEESWIREKEPLAAFTNSGRSLTATQNLQKKHNALQAEVAGRDKSIRAVEDTAASLVSAGHYAQADIEARLRALKDKWAGLNEMVAGRKTRLADAMLVQQYLADASEAEAWMAEKEPIVSNDDYGKDEDSAQALLKKHEAVEADLKTYESNIKALREECSVCKDVPATNDTPHTSPVKVAAAQIVQVCCFGGANVCVCAFM